MSDAFAGFIVFCVGIALLLALLYVAAYIVGLGLVDAGL